MAMTMLGLAVVWTMLAVALGAGPLVVQNVQTVGVSLSDVELQFYDKNNQATDSAMVPGSFYIVKGKIYLAAGIGPMQPDWTIRAHASHHEFFGWIDICDLLGGLCDGNLCDAANAFFGAGACKYLTNNEQARSIDVTEIGRRNFIISTITNPIIKSVLNANIELYVCMYDSKNVLRNCFGFKNPPLPVHTD